MRCVFPGDRLPVLMFLLALGQTVLAQTETRPEHVLPLVRSASHPVQQGFVRIINRSNQAGTVSIHAIDDSGQRFGPISLSLDAKETVHINSEDLERGNRSKGLPSGVGSGHGDWRLELDTNLDIEPLAYIRTSDGFVTSMHDIVTGIGSACSPTDIHVPIFNPASNRSQRSLLRLINPTERDLKVTIRGEDDDGEAPPEGNVRIELPAGAARTVTAQALESGGPDVEGRFGDGAGKWQLFVSADGDIEVMNLLQSVTGNLTNLSTTPRKRKEEAPRTALTSYELQHSVRRTDWRAFLSLDRDRFIHAVAYGDFDCDGDEDVFAAPLDITVWFPEGNDASNSIPTPVQVYANDGDGEFRLATERFIKGYIPEVILARKALTGDFNGDGRSDIFVAGTGSDVPPFPGEPPVLLLSSEGGLRSADGLEHLVGFWHGAASGDIDLDGDLDIFMADFRQSVFLMNDGLGNFVRDLSAVPSELTQRGVYTTEIIDVDEDGYLDLLVAGHEFEGQPSAVYWGDDSGRYNASRMTALPAVAGQGIVVDIDAEDLDGDGDRDIVLDRTTSDDDLGYAGHYIQIVANHGSRRFADETAQRVSTGSFRRTARWHEWIRLEDVDGDGDRDIWVDDIHHWGRTWVNDGSGRFAELMPAGFAPMDDQDFAARFVGKRMNSILFVDPWRFVATREGVRHTNTGYRYTNTGTDTGSLELDYWDIGLHCTLLLSFDSETTGTLTYTCDNGDTGAESWRLEDAPGT